jgi:regulator of protease activity HflC (stomatin/prohibitin superfamily)
MLGIRFIKFPPTTYVIHYSGGRLKREGPGLSFFYYVPTSVLVAVPQASNDMPFVFQEVTADFQTVTVQGALTYRIVDPKRLAGLLDYSINPQGDRQSDDPELLNQRLVQCAQILTRVILQRMKLAESLISADIIVGEILSGLRESETVLMHGLEILGLSIQSIRPAPETGRALEAEAREALLRLADGAIYDRRNAAVEQERRIRESELNTELAVEEKRRQIREAQMAAEIAVEEQRTVLVKQKIENDRQEADSRAYALEAVLKPLRESDWRTLMAVNGHDAQTMIAVAFRELAENAQKIGELNISPDLLNSLLGNRKA